LPHASSSFRVYTPGELTFSLVQFSGGRSIPYLIQPEEITPGRALFYTSTCGGCNAGCGLLVKNRDGRPIKLEGNPDHLLSRGGLCAVGQASLLGLYDSLRLKQPLKDGKPATWEEVDRAILAQLESFRRDGSAVRWLTRTTTSPTTRAVIESFLKSFPNARQVVYDPLSNSAILEAHELTHGVRLLPQFRFENAEVVVSFDADFLGTWISPVRFTRGYRAGRSLEGKPPRLSYHVQFESCLSLTGSKADERFRLAPYELGLVMTHLAARLAKNAGITMNASGPEESPVPGSSLDALANRLWRAHGRSLVVCGRQDVQTQALCNFLNHLLGNYGSTLDLEHPSLQSQGSDRELESLVRELHEGKVAALLIDDLNPAYELPDSEALAEALRRVPLLVSFAERLDETASLARYVCPNHHYLESWSDAEPVSGILSLRQPAIHHLGNTRPVLESLALWSGAPNRAYDLIRDYWKARIFPRQTRQGDFEAFWEGVLQDGYVEVAAEPIRAKPFDRSPVRPVTGAPRPPADAFALVLYPKVGMLDGRHSYNPWLQELPDPISKVTWDNYACLSPAAAGRLSVRDGDVVRLEAQGPNAQPRVLELPTLVQPGQHDAVVAVALGYGSNLSARFSKVGPTWIEARPSVGEDGVVGKNAAPFLELAGGILSSPRGFVKVSKTGKFRELASTQSHHALKVPERLWPR
jgi:molybdopterin-containing oxidoreductase family iron-sulfur binding subunit